MEMLKTYVTCDCSFGTNHTCMVARTICSWHSAEMFNIQICHSWQLLVIALASTCPWLICPICHSAAERVPLDRCPGGRSHKHVGTRTCRKSKLTRPSTPTEDRMMARVGVPWRERRARIAGRNPRSAIPSSWKLSLHISACPTRRGHKNPQAYRVLQRMHLQAGTSSFWEVRLPLGDWKLWRCGTDDTMITEINFQSARTGTRRCTFCLLHADSTMHCCGIPVKASPPTVSLHFDQQQTCPECNQGLAMTWVRD